MKKSALLVLTSILVGTLLVTSCCTPLISSDFVPSTGTGDFQDSKIVTITGKVEILPGGTPTLVAKWESKSRISYTIVEDLSEQIVRRVGEIITVECRVIAMDSPWLGKLAIISVHP